MKNLKKLIVIPLLVITLIGLGNINVSAKSISDIVEVPTDQTKLPATYSFIAGYTENTEVLPFGSDKWYKTKTSALGDGDLQHDYWNLQNPSDDLRGEVGVKYTNVGIYEGKTVDLKITVEDWEQYHNEKVYISYGAEDEISHRMTGTDFVDQTWKFYDHDTDEELEMTGTYIKITDLDNWQYVQMDKETSNRIYKAYVTESTAVEYDEKYGEFRFGVIGEKNWQSPQEVPAKDSDVTFLIDGNSLRFKWAIQSDQKPNDYDYTDDGCGTEYFGFSATKDFASEIVNPTKTVTDIDEENVEENTLSNLEEEFKYSIYHKVPSEEKQFYYSSYVIEDQIIDELEILDVKVFDRNDEDVSEYYRISTDDNLVKVEATDNVLKQDTFYDNDYRVDVTVKIKEGADLNEYITDGGVFLPNVAKVTIDGEEKESNETLTNILEKNFEIEKNIIDDNGDGYAQENEELTYEIMVSNTSANNNTIIVKDEITDSQVVFDASQNIKINRDITEYTIADLQKGIELEFEAEEIKTIEFTVNSIDNLNSKDIENIATATLGDDEKDAEVKIPTQHEGKEDVIQPQPKLLPETNEESHQYEFFRLFI